MKANMSLKPDADYSNTKTYTIAEDKHWNITTAEILTAARSLIEKPENWARGAVARTASGHRTSSLAPNAVCYCAVGALTKAQYDLEITTEELAVLNVINYLETFITGPVVEFNDCSPHAEVLELFDKAIAELNKPS